MNIISSRFVNSSYKSSSSICSSIRHINLSARTQRLCVHVISFKIGANGRLDKWFNNCSIIASNLLFSDTLINRITIWIIQSFSLSPVENLFSKFNDFRLQNDKFTIWNPRLASTKFDAQLTWWFCFGERIFSNGTNRTNTKETFACHYSRIPNAQFSKFANGLCSLCCRSAQMHLSSQNHKKGYFIDITVTKQNHGCQNLYHIKTNHRKFRLFIQVSLSLNPFPRIHFSWHCGYVINASTK